MEIRKWAFWSDDDYVIAADAGPGLVDLPSHATLIKEHNALVDHVEAQAALIREMAEALRKYGLHLKTCAFSARIDADCDCGLNALLARAKAMEAPEGGKEG